MKVNNSSFNFQHCDKHPTFPLYIWVMPTVIGVVVCQYFNSLQFSDNIQIPPWHGNASLVHCERNLALSPWLSRSVISTKSSEKARLTFSRGMRCQSSMRSRHQLLIELSHKIDFCPSVVWLNDRYVDVLNSIRLDSIWRCSKTWALFARLCKAVV